MNTQEQETTSLRAKLAEAEKERDAAKLERDDVKRHLLSETRPTYVSEELHARLTSAEAANAELRRALENLRDACHLADSNDELPSEIDGSLLDAARIALATQPPAILAVVRQLAAQLSRLESKAKVHADWSYCDEEALTAALTAAAPYLKP